MIVNPIVSGGGGSAPFFEIAQEELEHYVYDPESAILAVIYTNPPPNVDDPCLILPLTDVISDSMARGDVQFSLQDGFHYYLVSIGGGQIFIMNEGEIIIHIDSHGVESSSGWSVRLFVYKDKTT